MSERTFRILEHTADKGVAAKGNTLEEAFETAAYGVFSLFVELEKYQPEDKIHLSVTAYDLEELLFTWLSELIYRFEVDRRLPVDFHISKIENNSLAAVVDVRRVADDINWLGSGVKAITYHELKVSEEEDGWSVQVYVDV